jgi:hypothetical protein
LASSHKISIVRFEGGCSGFEDWGGCLMDLVEVDGVGSNENQSNEKYFLNHVQLKDTLLILI